MSLGLEPGAWIVPRWLAPETVRAITSTRRGPGRSQAPFDRFNLGTGAGDEPDAVAANRTALAAALSLPSEPRWLRQVHGANVVEFGPNAPVAPPEADAAVTREPGVVLAILTADCLPLLIASEDGVELAAIHAGWRGLAAGVIEAAVARMRTPPSRLMAWLGPAIGAGAYEVGDDVRDAFAGSHPRGDAAFRTKGPGKWHCDLYALARLRLETIGITRASGGDRCTSREPETFYSYRRDGRTGRMATLAWLER